MDEAERIMQGLARIAVAHPGCDAVVSEAIALIEGRGDELDRLCVSFAKLAAKSSQQQAKIERLKSLETCSCSHCVMCGAPKPAAKEAGIG